MWDLLYMLQKYRLNNFVLILIENNFLVNFNYEQIINDFKTKTVKRVIFK
jgi:hypothetical protein